MNISQKILSTLAAERLESINIYGESFCARTLSFLQNRKTNYALRYLAQNVDPVEGNLNANQINSRLLNSIDVLVIIINRNR